MKRQKNDQTLRERILALFTRDDKLHFSSIEQKIGLRSNKLAYHLRSMVVSQALRKEGTTYSLGESHEPLIPYLGAKTAAIPVVLVHVGTDKKAFLVRREKRPYKGKLGLPGGRLLVGESIEHAAMRIMREKYGHTVHPKSITSTTIEHIVKDGKIIHSFILFAVSATITKKTKEITYTVLKRCIHDVIESDYTLITQPNKEPRSIPTIFSSE